MEPKEPPLMNVRPIAIGVLGALFVISFLIYLFK